MGWTLKEEHEQFNRLRRRGEFPLARVAEQDWEAKREELLPYCLEAEGEGAGPPLKERNLTSLMRRFQQEFALLSCLIKAPPIDVVDLMKDRRIASEAQAGDMRSSLMKHIGK